MLKSLINEEIYTKLCMEIKNLSHAYLFQSQDKLLNNELANLFVQTIFCEKTPPCFECEACKRFEMGKNPDFIKVDKPNIAVDDVLSLLEKANLKPMIYKYNVILIENAENVNEIAQNKLLKSLEEPNDSTIFILTTVSEEKLLPTIRSRLKRINLKDFNPYNLKDELLTLGINEKFINSNFTLTEMFENSENKDYMNCVEIFENNILNLKSTQDIPEFVNNLKLSSQNKFLYLSLFASLFNSTITNVSIFSDGLMNYIKENYPQKLCVDILLLLDEANKKLKSNVNANYVFDDLIYQILKKKYMYKG